MPNFRRLPVSIFFFWKEVTKDEIGPHISYSPPSPPIHHEISNWVYLPKLNFINMYIYSIRYTRIIYLLKQQDVSLLVYFFFYLLKTADPNELQFSVMNSLV